MPRNLISIIDIAHAHNKRRQSIHKLVKRLRMDVVKKKSDNARGQAISYIAASDYEELKRQLEGSDRLVAETLTEGTGAFYMIQLEPQFDPGRFKVGFTTNISERIRSHRTSAPFSAIIKQWACKLLWEKTAIECMTQNCEQLHTEVFRTDNLDEVISRGDSFFGLMPSVAASTDHGEYVDEP